MQAKQETPPLLISDKLLANINKDTPKGVKIFPIYAYTLSDFCTKTKRPPGETHKIPRRSYIYDYNTNINIRLKFATIILINVFFPYDVKVIVDIW